MGKADDDTGMRGGNVPFSQDTNKVTTATKRECIAELRRIVKRHPDKVITRNYFRVNSKYAESAWNGHFGTWLEFKRQAGVILSRHAHRMERDIAKHASADRLRVLNGEKRAWEGKYQVPDARRWQTVIVANDLHDLHCDPFYLRVLLETIQRVQPERVVLNGDIFDLPEFSKHVQDPREFWPLKRIEWVHAFLANVRAAAPNTQIDLVEGNHEFRLLRHMSEATPALMTVLADLHGFTVPKLLGLLKYQVNYVARADITAWTERDITAQLRKNYLTLFNNSLLFGHFPHMRNMGIPGANGHHHSHLVWSAYSPEHGPWEWHQVGCGYSREATYCNAEKWGNGFLMVHCDTRARRSQFEYVDLTHAHAMVGGLFYQRTANEPVFDMPKLTNKRAVLATVANR